MRRKTLNYLSDLGKKKCNINNQNINSKIYIDERSEFIIIKSERIDVRINNQNKKFIRKATK